MIRAPREKNYTDWLSHLFLKNRTKEQYEEGMFGARTVTI